MELWSSSAAAFALVFVAELGDKTQLLCLTLTSRYRPILVWVAASSAFLLLNLLAVLLGAGIQKLIPPTVMGLIVAVLFGVFAWRSWQSADTDEEEAGQQSQSAYPFFSIFSVIFLGELGDKTQLAVAGLASTQAAFPVWLGASVALSTSAGLAAFLGAKVLTRLPTKRVHQSAAILFALFAVIALVLAIKGFRG